MAGVPYVGPGVLASAVAMDKEFAKKLLRAEGLPVGDYMVLRRGDPVSAVDLAALGVPVFVKPARSGSSVGITKVRQPADLPDAVVEALRHDDKVLVEAAVSGREVECGVLEGEDGPTYGQRAGGDQVGRRSRLVRLRGKVSRRRMRVRCAGELAG